MNLVDQLLKADIKKADELETKVFKSHKLAKVLGMTKEGATVNVKIREIKSRRLNDIMAYQIDRKGNFDFTKSYDAKLMLCVEGIAEPDLRNKELQKHFECTSAKDLCEKLLGNEVNDISDEISLLSGMKNKSNEDGEEEKTLEEEIKN